MKLINKERIQGFIAGLLITTGTWFFVVTIRQYFFETNSLTTQFIIAAILVISGWYLGAKK